MSMSVVTRSWDPGVGSRIAQSSPIPRVVPLPAGRDGWRRIQSINPNSPMGGVTGSIEASPGQGVVGVEGDFPAGDEGPEDLGRRVLEQCAGPRHGLVQVDRSRADAEA